MGTYNQTYDFEAALNGTAVKYISKPGLPAWDQVSPSAILLAEQATIVSTDRVLFMGCGHGAAAIPLANQLVHGELWLHDPSILALRCAQLTIQANQVQNATISNSITLLPTQAETFNTVLIDLPKGRQMGRRWLLEAAALLKQGGNLFLAGGNELGIQSLIKDGQALFGNVGILGYKKGARLAHFVKSNSSHANLPEWTGEPGVAPGSWTSYPLVMEGENYLIHTLPGVFSQYQLDEGTRLLLDHAPYPNGTHILDLGCGSGVIGMVIARRMQRAGQSPEVKMADSNLLAVAAAEKNIQANQITGAQAFAADLIEDAQEPAYDQIISNPPFHAGAEINYAISEALIAQSHAALVPGGELVLVANRFIRYNALMERMFSKVWRVYQDAHFHILAAKK